MIPRHGDQRRYRNHGCRCTPCRDAIAKDHAIYELRRIANGGDPLSVDKTGAVRRLRALMALGWPRRELARRAGYGGDAFAPILNGTRERLFLPTHQKICRLYDELSMTTGPSAQSRRIAQKEGWPPPLAWDDIDDPDEQPRRYIWARDHIPTTTKGRADQLRDLDARGASIDTACHELGINRDTLNAWCRRNGMRHVYRRLWARTEDQTINQWNDNRYVPRENGAA